MQRADETVCVYVFFSVSEDDGRAGEDRGG